MSINFGSGLEPWSPKNYNKSYISINSSNALDLKKIMRQLVDIHYIRNDLVLEPGSFRLLGENFEIFPIYDEYPIRIELFDNKIEYMYRFDPLNGTEIEPLGFIVLVQNFNDSFDHLFKLIDQGKKINL